MLQKKGGEIVSCTPLRCVKGYVTDIDSLCKGQRVWAEIQGLLSPGQPAVSKCKPGANRVEEKWNDILKQILGADNASHTELRKILSPAFSERSLRSWEPMFKKVSTQVVHRLQRYAREESKPVDMDRFFMYATFDIMGEFTLNQALGMVERMEFLDWIAGHYRNAKTTAFMMSAACLPWLQPVVAAL
jgi:cytochrome P450